VGWDSITAVSAAVAEVSGDFRLRTTEDGSEYLEVPEGSGSSLGGADGISNATFHLECSAPTDITLMGLVWAPDGDSNSVYLALDCGASRTWDLGAAEVGYGEGWVTDGGGPQTTFSNVSAGTHTVTVMKREDGVRLMALGFSEATPCIWQEGESAGVRMSRLARGVQDAHARGRHAGAWGKPSPAIGLRPA
jgi:hypothetical protein